MKLPITIEVTSSTRVVFNREGKLWLLEGPKLSKEKQQEIAGSFSRLQGQVIWENLSNLGYELIDTGHWDGQYLWDSKVNEPSPFVKEMVDLMAKEIAKEIDREVIKKIKEAAKADRFTVYSRKPIL